MTEPREGVGLTRRASLRLTLWGAVGLSLLPSRLLRRPEAGAAENPAAAKWARLGRIWREMSAHWRKAYEREDGEAKFDALKLEMTEALEALPAWKELTVLFEERWAHIHRERYSLATCYEMMAANPMQARASVEKQLEELRRLVGEGKLTHEAAAQAAATIAVDTEYMAQLRDLWETLEGGTPVDFMALVSGYREGKLEAGEGAERAGKHAVELELDRPGLLTDRVEEGDTAANP